MRYTLEYKLKCIEMYRQGIWLTAPVTEVLTFIAAIYFCVKSDKIMERTK